MGTPVVAFAEEAAAPAKDDGFDTEALVRTRCALLWTKATVLREVNFENML